MRIAALVSGLALAILAAASPLLGQDLAAAAQKERERRAKVAGAKAYTETDLATKASPAPSPSPKAATGPRTAPRRRVSKEEGGPASEASEATDEESTGKEEMGPATESVQVRLEAQRKKTQGLEASAKALEARIQELALDINPNSGDLFEPNRLQKRDAERREKISELENVKAQLERARQELADVEEEARRAGASRR